jgi:hypothetical protein
MEIFSANVLVREGEPLGGSDPRRTARPPCVDLEVNGLSFKTSESTPVEVVSLDALYAGKLVEHFSGSAKTHVFAASHTHYSPMLDAGKPKVGRYSHSGMLAFAHSINEAKRHAVHPTRCRVLVAEPPIPVYRRFDHPDIWINRSLSRHCGFFPNDDRHIDRAIRLFEFSDAERPLFVIAHHACHPVTSGVSDLVSADYIGALRGAIRSRFSVQTVLFFQGCAGDVRPNLAKKRINWLPRTRLNWKFDWTPEPERVNRVFELYRSAVFEAQPVLEFSIDASNFALGESNLQLADGRAVTYVQANFGEMLQFVFLPFEVSHLYHLEQMTRNSNRLLVSCSNDTLGYLAHPSQRRAGGYEVDGSIQFMGLSQPLEVRNWTA